MKCTECGREIGDNQKFCKYCGAPVKQIIVSVENTSKIKIFLFFYVINSRFCCVYR